MLEIKVCEIVEFTSQHQNIRDYQDINLNIYEVLEWLELFNHYRNSCQSSIHYAKQTSLS